MDELALIVDLHLAQPRQGPGSEQAAAQALALAGLDRQAPLQIADLGCGTGAGSLMLARHFPNARIVGIDFLEPFIERARQRARDLGVGDRIDFRVGQMEDPGLGAGSVDLVWSEGAIYNIGFDAGVGAWRPLLRPGGVMCVSEICWITPEREASIETFWTTHYPAIRALVDNERALRDAGFEMLGAFPLPAACWEDAYYRPLEASFDAFLARHGQHEDARRVVEQNREEIGMYRAHRDAYSYGFFVARRLD